MEAEIFGLYNDPSNVSSEEARSVYRMFQLHRDDILENERNWGVDLDGNPARSNAIAQANNNYPDLVQEYGQVQTLAAVLEPARDRLLEDLRVENPDLADCLQSEDFATTAIHFDPGRELRTGHRLRQDQRNNTLQGLTDGLEKAKTDTVDLEKGYDLAFVEKRKPVLGSRDAVIAGANKEAVSVIEKARNELSEELARVKAEVEAEGKKVYDSLMADVGKLSTEAAQKILRRSI